MTWIDLPASARALMISKLSAYSFVAAHNANQYRSCSPLIAREQEDLRDGWAAVEQLVAEAEANRLALGPAEVQA